jgi:type IV pilus assembly protein PilM
VSSQQAARMIHCPDCGQGNIAERKFCAGCGRGLWEPCLACGASNGALEKFCGVCGSNLLELVREQVERFDTVFEQALALKALYRHGEAIQQLELIEKSDHPRLKSYFAQCQELAQELEADFKRLQSKREDLFLEAGRLWELHRYEEAAAALQRVPEPLRLPYMQKLLDEVEGILAELPALEAAIKEAVANRRTQDILPRVQRYLELKPDNQEMLELGEKLGHLQKRQLETRRNQLINSARQKIALHEYALAERLVEQVHPSVRTPEIDKFFEYCQNRAQEVAWLIRDLQAPAVFDEHVLPLAERLQKLRPNDQAVARLVGRIRRLAEQHAAATHGKRRRSVPAQRLSPFGFPVDLLEGFRRIDDEQIRNLECYRQNYTSFYVACGLALQGLNRSRMSLNVLPGQKRSLLGLASSLLKKRPKAAWGINLGNHGLKAIKLAIEEDASKAAAESELRAIACEYIPYSQPLTAPDISPELMISEALEKFLQAQQLQDEAICVSYPAVKTLARFVVLPPADKKKLPDLIKFEARQQIPFPLENITWDHHVRELPGGEGRELTIFAVRTDEAQQYLFPFEQLKLNVDVLQPENLALHNYCEFDHMEDCLASDAGQETSKAHRRLAVLDLGAASTNLLVANQQTLWVRNIPLGSERLTKALISQFQLTYDQAEQWKQRPTPGAFASKTWRATEPCLRDLLSEVQRSLDSFEHNHRQCKIQQLLVVGGGIRLHGLLAALRDGLPDSLSPGGSPRRDQ